MTEAPKPPVQLASGNQYLVNRISNLEGLCAALMDERNAYDAALRDLRAKHALLEEELKALKEATSGPQQPNGKHLDA